MDPQDSPSVSKRPRLDTVNPVPSTSAVTLDSLSAAILVSPSTDVAGIPAAPVGESTIGTVADTKMNHNIPIPVGVVPAEEDVAPDVFDEEAHEEKLKIWDLFAEEYHDGASCSILNLSFDLERLTDDDDDELSLIFALVASHRP